MRLFDISDEYVDIPGYECKYRVNSKGNILSCKTGKILTSYLGTVTLSKNGKQVTRKIRELVAEVFLPGYHKGDPVFRISKDSDNVENLTLNPVLPYVDDDTWKSIPGYENIYQISVEGEIRSLNRYVKCSNGSYSFKSSRILEKEIGTDGYYHVGLVDKSGKFKLWSIHRLMAITFLSNPENKPQVNHIDGNKLNNLLENLEWVTRSENMQHAKKNGLWNPQDCGNISKDLTGIPVICITDNNKEFKSISEASRYYNMDFESIKESIQLGRYRKGQRFAYK